MNLKPGRHAHRPTSNHPSTAIFLLFLLIAAARAEETETKFEDCHVTLPTAQKYDLKALEGEQKASRNRETPPTAWVDEVRFNLCADLGPLDGVSAEDQCPPGTRACLTQTNQKGDNGDRVVSVIPLATSDSLNAEFSAISSPKGLSVTFSGASYPDTDPQIQTFHLTILCAETASGPRFKSYNGHALNVDWDSPAGCPLDHEFEDDKTGQDGGSGETHVGSGLGWYFLLFVIAFAVYFAIGAYYNYSTYGATGLDLIPHRDFWRDVPYLIRDLVSHLCSTIRPRHGSSRSGYIAV